MSSQPSPLAVIVPIPDAVSDVEAAASILNFVTAWQMIHRVAAGTETTETADTTDTTNRACSFDVGAPRCSISSCVVVSVCRRSLCARVSQAN